MGKSQIQTYIEQNIEALNFTSFIGRSGSYYVERDALAKAIENTIFDLAGDELSHDSGYLMQIAEIVIEKHKADLENFLKDKKNQNKYAYVVEDNFLNSGELIDGIMKSIRTKKEELQPLKTFEITIENFLNQNIAPVTVKAPMTMVGPGFDDEQYIEARNTLTNLIAKKIILSAKENGRFAKLTPQDFVAIASLTLESSQESINEFLNDERIGNNSEAVKELFEENYSFNTSLEKNIEQAIKDQLANIRTAEAAKDHLKLAGLVKAKKDMRKTAELELNIVNKEQILGKVADKVAKNIKAASWFAGLFSYEEQKDNLVTHIVADMFYGASNYKMHKLLATRDADFVTSFLLNEVILLNKEEIEKFLRENKGNKELIDLYDDSELKHKLTTNLNAELDKLSKIENLLSQENYDKTLKGIEAAIKQPQNNSLIRFFTSGQNAKYQAAKADLAYLLTREIYSNNKLYEYQQTRGSKNYDSLHPMSFLSANVLDININGKNLLTTFLKDTKNMSKSERFEYFSKSKLPLKIASEVAMQVNLATKYDKKLLKKEDFNKVEGGQEQLDKILKNKLINQEVSKGLNSITKGKRQQLLAELIAKDVEKFAQSYPAINIKELTSILFAKEHTTHFNEFLKETKSLSDTQFKTAYRQANKISGNLVGLRLQIENAMQEFVRTHKVAKQTENKPQEELKQASLTEQHYGKKLEHHQNYDRKLQVYSNFSTTVPNLNQEPVEAENPQQVISQYLNANTKAVTHSHLLGLRQGERKEDRNLLVEQLTEQILNEITKQGHNNLILSQTDYENISSAILHKTESSIASFLNDPRVQNRPEQLRELYIENGQFQADISSAIENVINDNLKSSEHESQLVTKILEDSGISDHQLARMFAFKLEEQIITLKERYPEQVTHEDVLALAFKFADSSAQLINDIVENDRLTELNSEDKFKALMETELVYSKIRSNLADAVVEVETDILLNSKTRGTQLETELEGKGPTLSFKTSLDRDLAIVLTRENEIRDNLKNNIKAAKGWFSDYTQDRDQVILEILDNTSVRELVATSPNPDEATRYAANVLLAPFKKDLESFLKKNAGKKDILERFKDTELSGQINTYIDASIEAKLNYERGYTKEQRQEASNHIIDNLKNPQNSFLRRLFHGKETKKYDETRVALAEMMTEQILGNKNYVKMMAKLPEEFKGELFSKVVEELLATKETEKFIKKARDMNYKDMEAAFFDSKVFGKINSIIDKKHSSLIPKENRITTATIHDKEQRIVVANLFETPKEEVAEVELFMDPRGLEDREEYKKTEHILDGFLTENGGIKEVAQSNILNNIQKVASLTSRFINALTQTELNRQEKGLFRQAVEESCKEYIKAKSKVEVDHTTKDAAKQARRNAHAAKGKCIEKIVKAWDGIMQARENGSEIGFAAKIQRDRQQQSQEQDRPR